MVSPLISLMHDQITGLKSRGIRAVSTSEKAAERVAMNGECSLLYTTPESALGRFYARFAFISKGMVLN